MRTVDRELAALALPALGSLIAQPLFVLIDSAIVGHLGTAELAGLSLASNLVLSIAGLCVFLAFATTTTVSRSLGAGRLREGLQSGIDGMWLGLGLGAVLAIALFVLAPWATGALGGSGAVAANAITYLRYSAPGLPATLVILAATGVLRGLKNLKAPLIVAVLGASANAGLNYLLVYRAGMGIAGSALGTSVLQWAMAAWLVGLVVVGARREGASLTPAGGGIWAAARGGGPLLARTLALRVAIMATVVVATRLGDETLAGYQIVASLWGFAAFTLDALAIAAQTLSAQALGEREAARAKWAKEEVTGVVGGARAASFDRTHGADPSSAQDIRATEEGPTNNLTPAPKIGEILSRSVRWAVGCGALLGLALAAAAWPLATLFTSDAGVRRAASLALVVVGVLLPIGAYAFLLDGVLMGVDDGRFLAVIGFVNLGIYLAPLWLVDRFAVGNRFALAWLWVALAGVFMAARAITTGLRTRHAPWQLPGTTTEQPHRRAV